MPNLKMRIAICDDNTATLDILVSSINSIFRSHGVLTETVPFSDVRALAASMETSIFDLLFLDIDMPQMDGITFSKSLRAKGNPIPIIFVSNREDKVFDSLDSHPFGFIRKSNFLTDITKVIQQFLDLQTKEAPKQIIITTRGQSIAIPLDNVIRIEGSRKNQLVYVKDQPEPYVMASTMNKLEEELDDYGFITCYKGVMVNYRFISVIRDDDILLTNGKTIPMSRRKANETKERFLNLMKEKANFVF